MIKTNERTQIKSIKDLLIEVREVKPGVFEGP